MHDVNVLERGSATYLDCATSRVVPRVEASRPLVDEGFFICPRIVSEKLAHNCRMRRVSICLM